MSLGRTLRSSGERRRRKTSWNTGEEWERFGALCDMARPLSLTKSDVFLVSVFDWSPGSWSPPGLVCELSPSGAKVCGVECSQEASVMMAVLVFSDQNRPVAGLCVTLCVDLGPM